MNIFPTIQCLWIGKELSRMEQLSIRSFLHYGNDVHLYVYEEIKNVPFGTIQKDANIIIPKEKIFKYRDYNSYAGFANLFRYKLLLEKGGYWADLDIVCLKSIKEANQPYIFASERIQKGIQVNNCFIYAPKNSNIMEYCYDCAASKDSEKLQWGDTGPKLLTEAVINHKLHEYVLHPVVVCPINYWHCRLIVSECFDKLIHSDSYMVHLWNEMWRRNGMDKSHRYSKNSLYEKLQEKFNPRF